MALIDQYRHLSQCRPCIVIAELAPWATPAFAADGLISVADVQVPPHFTDVPAVRGRPDVPVPLCWDRPRHRGPARSRGEVRLPG